MTNITPKKTLLGSSSLTRLALSAAIALSGLAASPALAQAIDDAALPTGGNVAVGAASFAQDGNTLHINQASQNALINWSSFNIGEKAAAQFNQPNASALAVNRVSDVNPSQIMGSLRANGQVVILNNNGVVFGKNSHVDVAGLLVSTGDIDQDDFAKTGKINLSNINGKNGKVVNDGQIQISNAGIAAFVAPEVVNNGLIEAKLGKIALASGSDKATVDMYGDGLVELALDDKAGKAVITNNGSLRADGGKIAITVKAAKGVVDSVVNLNGVVEANSFSQKNGVITLNAENADIHAAGAINAKGGKGKVALHSNKNIKIARAAKINADGGNGSVTVIGDQSTLMDGTISAQGENGFVETSGGLLGVHGNVTLSQGGKWLLDPTNIVVVGGNGDGPGDNVDGVITADDTAGNSQYRIGVNFINNALNNGNDVTLQTSAKGVNEGNITVRAAIVKTSGGASSLVFNAHNDISVQNSIRSEVGALNITLNADFDGDSTTSQITFSNGADIHSNGGDVAFNAPGNITLMEGSRINAEGGNITFTQGGRLGAFNNSIRTSGTGEITIAQNTGGSIQSAVNAIYNTGTGLNTVNVGAGTFEENLNIRQGNLNLNGANAKKDPNADPSLRGPETIILSSSNAFNVTADNVTIDGFTTKSQTISFCLFCFPGFPFPGFPFPGFPFPGFPFPSVSLMDNSVLATDVANLTISNNVFVGGNNGVRTIGGNMVSIQSNAISDTEVDGIRIEGNTGNVAITGNTVVNAGDNGIQVTSNSNDEFPIFNFMEIAPLAVNEDLVLLPAETGEVAISGNTITNAGNSGISLDTVTTGNISDNTVNGNTTTGLLLDNDNGQITLSGNTVNSVDGGYGARINSGIINLLGAANRFNGGDVGMSFNGSTQPVFEEIPLRLMDISLAAGENQTLSLVDNSFGSTVFNGQSGYYIQLENGALFGDDVDPALLNASQVNFDGFQPNSFLISQNDFDGLMPRLYHYPNDNTLGLIFFGIGVPPANTTQPANSNPTGVADINDILPRQQLVLLRGATGASVTILGLPFASLST
ncbi:MAG: putative exported hemagglutinin-like protein, partial [Alphaproteobacteria bacterium]|nr:putative exported hemagglutinin-like protein [Alphaproteobacteria bacterium]